MEMISEFGSNSGGIQHATVSMWWTNFMRSFPKQWKFAAASRLN